MRRPALRLGLFEQLFWRVLVVLAAVVVLLAVFIHVFMARYLQHLRPGISPFPQDGERAFMIGLGLVLVLAAAILAPMTRNLARQLRRLGDLARRVADGDYGAGLELPRQRELAELTLAFNDMSQRLKGEEQRRRRLIADVSHELRSPLARIRALAETAARRPSEAETLLARVDAEITLMDRMVGDLLQTARYEVGAEDLALEPVALGAWAGEAFLRLKRRIEHAGAACVIVVDPSEAQVTIDPQRLMQVLGNLVENALTATAGMAAPRVDLTLQAAADGWSLVVSDNGRGVDEADLPFAFDRFYRADRNRGRSTGGAGLGLSIARAIVLAHRGRVALEPAPGGGVLARVTIPWG